MVKSIFQEKWVEENPKALLTTPHKNWQEETVYQKLQKYLILLET